MEPGSPSSTSELDSVDDDRRSRLNSRSEGHHEYTNLFRAAAPHAALLGVYVNNDTGFYAGVRKLP